MEPRLSYLDGRDPAYAEPSMRAPDDPIDAEDLWRRMQALRAVLDDLPKHARRLLRLQARRAASGLRALSPLRPGWPPGHRTRRFHPVDEVLKECDALARLALEPPDTS